MAHTHVTGPTLFAEAMASATRTGVSGKKTGVPLPFMQHFRGGLDHFDCPAKRRRFLLGPQLGKEPY